METSEAVTDILAMTTSDLAFICILGAGLGPKLLVNRNIHFVLHTKANDEDISVF